jgi:hypothetical protein
METTVLRTGLTPTRSPTCRAPARRSPWQWSRTPATSAASATRRLRPLLRRRSDPLRLRPNSGPPPPPPWRQPPTQRRPLPHRHRPSPPPLARLRLPRTTKSPKAKHPGKHAALKRHRANVIYRRLHTWDETTPALDARARVSGVRAVRHAADRDSVVGVESPCAVPMPRSATRPARHAPRRHPARPPPGTAPVSTQSRRGGCINVCGGRGFAVRVGESTSTPFGVRLGRASRRVMVIRTR